MKITARQLRRLIKEEFKKCIIESRENDPRDAWIYGPRFHRDREPEFDLDVDKIKNAEIENVFSYDYPDFVDATISSGEYEHSPGEFRKLTEDEIDYINDNEDTWMQKQAYEQWI